MYKVYVSYATISKLDQNNVKKKQQINTCTHLCS